MNRGRRGEPIFIQRKDYQVFIELLKGSSETWNIRIAAYCLMPNHIPSPVSSVSERMKALIAADRVMRNRAETLISALTKSQEQT